ncbi:M28 family peptidase [Roseomonas sp. PWR1]|uniref:Carboxypeptidase Q n=1 Tax=Roseomonas nitratireducens TaxID=2820810 RepID=A0ABS4ARD3_9PROT|nr:M28 family peptidase [Neoroseomonas nitratireducens]
MTLEAFLGAVAADAALASDFAAICDTGGRLQGSDSAACGFSLLHDRMAAIGAVTDEPVPYAGWRCHEARVTDLASGRDLACAPLLGAAATPPGGIVLDTLDCGRGAPGAYGDAAGRATLARHEYPFAAWTVHRRFKLAAATEAGAAAFLIVQPEPGVGPVSGSSGRNGGAGIPALGISAEAGALLAEGRRVRITLAGEDMEATTPTLLLDLPGRGPGRVMLSAHLDGHPLGESAIDNATGLAAALSLARAAARFVEGCPRGLTLCIFGAEEWALSGSRAWLAGMPAERRARMAVNLNLDSIAGGSRLTALTSGFPALGPFLRDAAGRAGLPLGVHLPLMSNSDHANFAAHGIPAARLVAGFDEPGSALRYLLTAGDTRAIVPAQELKGAAITAAALLWAALTAPDEAIAALR